MSLKTEPALFAMAGADVLEQGFQTVHRIVGAMGCSRRPSTLGTQHAAMGRGSGTVVYRPQSRFRAGFGLVRR